MNEQAMGEVDGRLMLPLGVVLFEMLMDARHSRDAMPG
jgi:hypothetical protein